MTDNHHYNIGNKYNLKHGMEHTSTYRVWANMLQRCSNPSNSSYKNYGKRGIRVCERWKDFSNFFTDMGECPRGLSTDRRNNNKGYYKDNCRWTTRMEQSENSRRCVYITFKKKTMSIAQWERYLNFRRCIISNRINKPGWSIKRTITQPPIYKKGGK